MSKSLPTRPRSGPGPAGRQISNECQKEVTKVTKLPKVPKIENVSVSKIFFTTLVSPSGMVETPRLEAKRK
jgi:hypothetical protein